MKFTVQRTQIRGAVAEVIKKSAIGYPGVGESPAPMPDYRPTAAPFADVVAAVDLPSAVFIGNSVGGFAAARLAITDPQRVSHGWCWSTAAVSSPGRSPTFTAGP
jgi:alpha/beta hydrolase family protein